MTGWHGRTRWGNAIFRVTDRTTAKLAKSNVRRRRRLADRQAGAHEHAEHNLTGGNPLSVPPYLGRMLQQGFDMGTNDAGPQGEKNETAAILQTGP